MRYAGFWRRFGSLVIDALILLPITAIELAFAELSRLALVYALLPNLLIGLFFHLYLVHRYGGTPGKLLLGIRIAMRDGSPVTLEAAALRYSVGFVFGVLESVGLLVTLLDIGDDAYLSASFFGKFDLIRQGMPAWCRFLSTLQSVWFWSEVVTMLFNKERRAIHDLIAGTVVVHR